MLSQITNGYFILYPFYIFISYFSICRLYSTNGNFCMYLEEILSIHVSKNLLINFEKFRKNTKKYEIFSTRKLKSSSISIKIKDFSTYKISRRRKHSMTYPVKKNKVPKPNSF